MPEPTLAQLDDAFYKVLAELGQMRVTERVHAVTQHAAAKMMQIQDQMLRSDNPVQFILDEERRLLTAGYIRVDERDVLHTAFSSLRGYLQAKGVSLPAMPDLPADPLDKLPPYPR